MNVWRHRIRRLLGCTFSAGFLLLNGGVQGADAHDVVVTIDRTTRAWSDLALGAPSSEDDADQSRFDLPSHDRAVKPGEDPVRALLRTG